MDDDFGATLREARHRRGMSQRELASLSGVHQPTIAAVETGRRQPTAPVRTALERAVRVRPSEALRAHRAELRAAIERHHGTGAQVFGSTARGEDDLDSDLDLIVSLPDGTGLIALGRLIHELELIAGVHVDVIDGRADGAVMQRALAEAVPL